MGIEDKKKDRYYFLQSLYDSTDGNSGAFLSMWELGSEIGFDKTRTSNVVDYLMAEGLIESRALGGYISITHDGVIEIEESNSNPDSPTLHFLPLNLIQIENMNNSAIQQGSNYSVQTINFTTEKLDQIGKIVDDIDQLKNEILLDKSLFEELISEVNTIKSQIKSPKPKSVILKESLNSIRSIFEGIAGNIVTPVIIEQINNILK
jgi:hypothetical protein